VISFGALALFYGQLIGICLFHIFSADQAQTVLYPLSPARGQIAKQTKSTEKSCERRKEEMATRK
jgi:hypothetical protein